MSSPHAKGRLLAGILLAAAALLVAGWLWWWQPERAVKRQSEKLLRLVEKRDLEAISPLLAPTFEDMWGFGRSEILRSLEEGLRHFLFLRLWQESWSGEPEPAPLLRLTESGRVLQRLRLRIQASGSPLGMELIRKFHSLPGAFTLEWEKHPTAWPPLWKLRRLEHDAATHWAW